MTDPSDPFAAVPVPDADPAPEIEVDASAFLPDGVAFGEPAEDDIDEGDDVDETEPVDEADELDATEDAAPVEAIDPEVDVTEPDPVALMDAVESGPGRPDLSALEQIETELSAVDAALEALDGGTYGTCTVCDAAIDDVLLAADPTRRPCAEHAVPA